MCRIKVKLRTSFRVLQLETLQNAVRIDPGNVRDAYIKIEYHYYSC